MDDSLERARAVFRDAPFVADLGIVPVSVGEGACQSVLVLERRHLQHTGQAHAGVVTALADHTAGAAAQSLVAAQHLAITAELKLSLMRPARGRELACSARVLKAGRSLVFAEAEVWCRAGPSEAGTLVAKLSATLAVVPAPEPDPDHPAP